MRAEGGPGFDVSAFLHLVEAAAPVEAVEQVADALAERVGASRVSFLIADFSGRAVVRLTTTGGGADGTREQAGEHAETVALPGSRYERVLRTQQVDVRDLDGGARLVVPVTDRGDAIGLVELDLPHVPTARVVADVAAAAHALAYVVIAARRHTDVFEWGQRTTPFSLAAEIQRRLLPASYTCEAGQFTLAGWLEPASSVGGDTFDYSLDRTSLQVSITDAVGHQVAAALLATLLVGSLRNGRRKGPLRLRGGRVEEIELGIDPPFGIVPGRQFTVQPISLEPGDRIVLLTDGMQERNAASLDVARALADTADLHAREVVHALGDAVLHATGRNLRDDATMVCIDWYGGPMRRREGRYGADQSLASSARTQPGR
jgi:hypothetical protein